MIIDKIFEKKISEFQSHTREKDEIYVTDLVQCPLKYHFSKNYRELELQTIFEPQIILGDLVHLGFHEIIRKIFGNETVIMTEVELKNIIEYEGITYTIKGRADNIIKTQDGETFIIEVKSAKSSLGIPHQHHIQQLQIYLWMTGIKKGILVYFTNDKITEYFLETKYNNSYIQNMIRQLIEMNPAPKYDWECDYCPFIKICPRAVRKSEK
jgi:CRISPR-associated exonuclease Cas4